MSEENLATIRSLLITCTEDEQKIIFRELRERHQIHEFERVIGAPAEMILEAVHRAPELTRRMLRGVIADAAFRTFVIPSLLRPGWKDVTPHGNFAYDYMLSNGKENVSVQVKLQRSERGEPVIRSGQRYGFDGDVFTTETQKTRTGSDGDQKTRPYRYGEFDVLAVSMQPSTLEWNRYMYTLGRWLLPGKRPGEIATIQPVAQQPNDFWTDQFIQAVAWLHADDNGKRLHVLQATRKTKSATSRRRKKQS